MYMHVHMYMYSYIHVYVYTVVSRKRAPGWCTLLWAQTGGVGGHSSYQYCVLLSAQSGANSA